MKLFSNIGNTPLLDLGSGEPGRRAGLLAKLEWFNPTGSIKDRVANYIINNGFKSGQLGRDKTVLEATTGNMGVSLGMVCACLGLRLELIMPEGSGMEFRPQIMSYGARIIPTPTEKGLDGALKAAYDIVEADPESYFLANQFNNGANPQAHYEGTGSEILKQTKAEITHLVAGMGTTGTLMGAGRRLREKFPDIRIIGVEPAARDHGLPGLRHFYNTILPGVYDPSKIHEVIQVTDEQAAEALGILYRNHGLTAGPSSGAALHAAIEVAGKAPPGSTIITIFPDRGDRYLDSEIFKSLIK
jgi:cysteine synthase